MKEQNLSVARESKAVFYGLCALVLANAVMAIAALVAIGLPIVMEARAKARQMTCNNRLIVRSGVYPIGPVAEDSRPGGEYEVEPQ
jgi:hypothetical protein